ncbi:hypothetical protein NicSoilB8_17280 [Arthrobacter sp. NicSoilB8]|nr:hypothetical protein NicSoilB8_17280 [Arthrobacter sp. NicSoilB8]
MAKLAPDMSSADLVANTLDPRFKGDPGQLPVATPRNPVPHGNSDVLHDIIHIAGPPDSREAGYDVTMHAVNRDHDPVDRNDGFSWQRCASQ